MSTRVLVTGATGFVGGAVVRRLTSDGATIRAASRRAGADLPAGAGTVVVSELSSTTDWSAAVSETDVVVHTAARVHVMNDAAADPLAEFRRVNVDGTLQVARQAAYAGVRRFVFVSSIKVNGEGTRPGHPYHADDAPAPADPYGISKLEAEEGLRRLAHESGMEVAIIRPVLVYGPGVKGNFATMVRSLARGVPLPLGAVHNKRSLVALDNLVDLIATCVEHPAATNQVFLVSDGEDLSTTELLERAARAMGKRARLVPVPSAIMSATARLLGKEAVANRLLGSLQVDISKTRELLAWTPPVGVDESLAKTVAHLRR